MFGNLMGDMKEKQEAMREKLASILVEAESGAVKVTANANREITDVSIDQSKLEDGDLEQLEDLLLVAINRVLQQAAEKEAAEAQNMIKDIMPPGFGGLSNLFG